MLLFTQSTRYKGSVIVLAFYMSLVDDENEKSIIEELYKSNKKKMYSIAFSCLRNSQDAEDVVHEAFLVAIEKNKKIFSIPSNKRAPYLNVIVRNVCYSIMRKKKPLELSDEADVTAEKYFPEEEAISDIECERLIGLISSLPEGQRDAMYLKCRFGFTDAEIAVSLSISENSVRNRIYNARKAMKAKLDKD